MKPFETKVVQSFRHGLDRIDRFGAAAYNRYLLTEETILLCHS